VPRSRADLQDLLVLSDVRGEGFADDAESVAEPGMLRLVAVERVEPRRKSTVSRVGVVPAGTMRSEPDAVAFVTVTFAATAMASGRMPQRPPSVKSRDAPG
jgi:hypothetical protein